MSYNQLAVRRVLAEVRAESAGLVAHLRTLQPFQWIVNPGNAGDGLIVAGTRALFRQSGLEFWQTTHVGDHLRSDLPIVYGGGGAWCDTFGIGAKIVAEVATRCPYVLVLPSTFEAARLREVRHISQLYLYGRDHRSVTIAQELGFAAEFAPDPAFWAPLPRVSDCGGDGTLAAFRRDRIGTEWPLDPEAEQADITRDLSREGDHTSEDWLLQQVCRFDRVHTDRLHAAIAATITGRETVLYPNGRGYHKSRELFASSLSKFPNCRLASDIYLEVKARV